MDDQRPIPMNDPGFAAAWHRLRPWIPQGGQLERDVFIFGEEAFMAGRAARDREIMATARERARLTSREDDRGEGAL